MTLTSVLRHSEDVMNREMWTAVGNMVDCSRPQTKKGLPVKFTLWQGKELKSTTLEVVLNVIFLLFSATVKVGIFRP